MQGFERDNNTDTLLIHIGLSSECSFFFLGALLMIFSGSSSVPVSVKPQICRHEKLPKYCWTKLVQSSLIYAFSTDKVLQPRLAIISYSTKWISLLSYICYFRQTLLVSYSLMLLSPHILKHYQIDNNYWNKSNNFKLKILRHLTKHL